MEEFVVAAVIDSSESGAVSDARAVLREVFRELDFFIPCGDAASRSAAHQQTLLPEDARFQGSSGDHSKLRQQELDLQIQYAKRLAREPLPNIYQLQSPASQDDVTWHRSDIQILRRRDLKPPVDQDAGGNKSLWVRNILTRSSGDLAARKVVELRANLPIKLEPTDAATPQSVSIGELVSRRSVPPPPVERPRPQPTHVVCIPPRLHFVNFTVGQVHTQSIRLVNMSKLELRLSVRPPARPELAVELCSRLVLVSGSAAELKVHLRAGDVRALSDRLLVRVSSGQTLLVPIACYLEPPLLHISIPSASIVCVSSARIPTSSPHTLELGAVLLGDMHRAPLLLRCSATHAAFFLMSQDSWDSFTVQVTASSSNRSQKWGVSTDCFYFTPVRWSGGGSTRGLAVCRARRSGLHTADLRVVSSTATVRSLTFLADVLLFSPDHVTLEAHEKDYDICSEGDPACEYYVQLGTAFPHRSLQATIKIINKSPLIYNYYWSSRPWGVCSCWEQFQRLPAKEHTTDALCVGAMDAKTRAKKGEKSVSDEESLSCALRVTSPSGCLMPHAETTVNVQVPDVGDVGEKRMVLILILQHVPQESFPSDYDAKIVEKKEIQEKSIPGVCESWSRTVCDVVCAQLEVWWSVEPVLFALEPPLLLLPHSRRVKAVKITLRSTQLCGASGVQTTWRDLTPAPSPPALAPLQCAHTTALLPLGELPDHLSQTHLIQLVAASEEHIASCRVRRWCSTRHPALRPAFAWLGVQPPGAPVATQLTVFNDTHQKIYWRASVHRVCRERGALGSCVARAPCGACCSRACACDALSCSRGALRHDQSVTLRYCVNAPDSDGCVATLVRVARTAADTAREPSARGTEARAALLAYRVLAPRLVLRVEPCRGDEAGACEGCALDARCDARGGSPVLRVGSLALGGRSCFRVQLTNLTPQPTRVTWEPAIEGEDVLAVTFIPNGIQIGGHDIVEILLVLEARAVCARRVFVRRAQVDHAPKPLYLLIDAAVSGVEVIVQFPIGGGERTDSYVKIPMLQKELSTRNESKKLVTPEDLFAQDDFKRVLQKESSCRCTGHENNMIYIPSTAPPAHLSPAPGKKPGECSPVEILEELPPQTRVCPCVAVTKPQLPEDSEPYCLQFHRLPLRTVRSRTIVLHNSSLLEARFRTAVRRWPRRHTRTIDADQWAGDVWSSGIVLEAAPATGSVAARSSADVIVSVYADCWGVYHDQILIEVEHLEPLVLDVWVEAVGPPLQLRLSPALQADKTPTLWVSRSNATRAVHVTNTSRARLYTDVFLLREHEHPQDALPFRLYVKFLDVAPRTCLCATTYDTASSKSEEECSSTSADTDIELFLASDFGLQTCDNFFQVEPQQFGTAAGEGATLTVHLQRHAQPAPAHAMLLRSEPVASLDAAWHRPPPPLQVVQLREAQRSSQLQALCSELRVTLCALDLPHDDILRVRKKFSVKNTGEGGLEVVATTEAPWRVELSRNVCDSLCVRVERHKPFEDLKLNLLPRSSIELFAEVSVRASEAWPAPGAEHPPRRLATTDLRFHDLDHVLLLTLPLVLELELPQLRTEPPSLLDFGFVGDGSTRKSYFSVSHSSRSAMDLTTQWIGDPQFRLHPPTLSVPAGASARVYVQYTASWMSERFSEGRACVHTYGAARAWCRAELRVRARATRPRAMHAALHADHTDDAHLLPDDVPF